MSLKEYDHFVPIKEKSTITRVCQTKNQPIAQIIKNFLKSNNKNKNKLTTTEQANLNTILKCVNNELGYILKMCETCNTKEFIAFCTCNNRYCPNCGGKRRKEWFDRIQNRMPDGKYFHFVFTIPHEFNQLLFSDENKRIIYDAIMKASAATLLEFSKNEFDSVPFILSVLHTWSQDMGLHIHTHSLVSAKMYNSSKDKWTNVKSFLFHQNALAKVFRAKFLNILRLSLDETEKKRRLTIKNNDSLLVDWLSFVEKLPKKWNIYVSNPRNDCKNILKYFAIYLNRSAITNSRIAEYNETSVKIFPKKREYNEGDSTKDKTKYRKKTLFIYSIDEFIKKFCSHFLPPYFHKIRYYGMASPSNTAKRNKENNITKGEIKKERAKCIHCSAQTVVIIIVRVSVYTGKKKYIIVPLYHDTS